MTSAFLDRPARPLAQVAPLAASGGAAPPFFSNIWLDVNGRPCIEECFADEGECLQQIADQAAGHTGWHRHTYAGTLRHAGGGIVTLADRSRDADDWDRARLAAERLDRTHDAACRRMAR